MRSIERSAAVGCGVLATVLALPVLAFPLGHDQAVHYYVAREWFTHGAVPYRDAFDHKTPGIYALHALGMAMFGATPSAIRPLEILTMLVLGALVGMLATHERRPSAVMIGASMLATSFLYNGYFGFLSSAQPELWVATFGVAALVVARRARTSFIAAGLGVGVLGGAALVVKPSSLPFAILATLVLYLRARSSHGPWRGLVPVIAAVAAASAMGGAVLLYLARVSGLDAFFEVVVRGNAVYFHDNAGVRGVNDFVHVNGELFGWFHPVGTILLVSLAVSCLRGRVATPRRALGVALVATGWASVAMQLKFHIYHYVTIIPGIALLLVDLVAAAAARFPRNRTTAALAATMAIVLAYPLAGRRARNFTRVFGDTLKSAVGLPHTDTALAFESADHRDYVHARSVAIAAWLRAHSAPDDLVSVRGFHPEIYALADRRHSGRFFWTLPYTYIMRGFRAEAWRAEDRRALEDRPPRYVVVSLGDGNAPEPDAWFLSRGYAERTIVAGFRVLERSSHETTARK